MVGTQKGHSQALCQWCHLGILNTFTQDFKEPPYFNAKSLGVGQNSYLIISLSRGMGEAKDPSYTRSPFKSKLPGSPGGKRQIRHPSPPPEFLFLWLWVGVCKQRMLPFYWVATWCFRRKRKLQSSHGDMVGLRWPSLQKSVWQYLYVLPITPASSQIFPELFCSWEFCSICRALTQPTCKIPARPFCVCTSLNSEIASEAGAGGTGHIVKFGVWSPPPP